MFAATRGERSSPPSKGRVSGPASLAGGTPVRRAARGTLAGSGPSTAHGCACGGGCPRCQAKAATAQSSSRTAATTGWHPQEHGAGGANELKGGGTSRKDLFCHTCAQPKSLKVSIYSQGTTILREDNVTFAKIFMANHNVTVETDNAGVIPSVYDQDARKWSKVETVADLCDIVKALENRGDLPGSGIPAFFIPFGAQLAGSAADTVGWHIPDINVNCEAHIGKCKTTKLLLIDSNPEVKSCSKVLLHEIGHAVGNGDRQGTGMIMGPCDPGAPQDPPIGCNPDREHNLMTASEVKKFCAGA